MKMFAAGNQPSLAGRPRRWRRLQWPLAFTPLAFTLLVCALAGCGALSAAGGLAGTSSPSGSSARGTPTRSAPANGSGSSSLVACPGGTGSASGAGTPALVFGPTTTQRQGTAQGNALVQIQLSARLQWRLVDVQVTGPNAQVLAPAGYLDTALGACIWDIRLPSSGTVTIDFTATSLCTLPGACTQYVLRATYTISVQ